METSRRQAAATGRYPAAATRRRYQPIDGRSAGEDGNQATRPAPEVGSVEQFDRRLPDGGRPSEAPCRLETGATEPLRADGTVDEFPEAVEAFAAWDAHLVSIRRHDPRLAPFRLEAIPAGEPPARQRGTTSGRVAG